MMPWDGLNRQMMPTYRPKWVKELKFPPKALPWRSMKDWQGNWQATSNEQSWTLFNQCCLNDGVAANRNKVQEVFNAVTATKGDFGKLREISTDIARGNDNAAGGEWMLCIPVRGPKESFDSDVFLVEAEACIGEDWTPELSLFELVGVSLWLQASC